MSAITHRKWQLMFAVAVVPILIAAAGRLIAISPMSSAAEPLQSQTIPAADPQPFMRKDLTTSNGCPNSSVPGRGSRDDGTGLGKAGQTAPMCEQKILDAGAKPDGDLKPTGWKYQASIKFCCKC